VLKVKYQQLVAILSGKWRSQAHKEFAKVCTTHNPLS